MFLTEAALSAKIRSILQGQDVACAVAFWGYGSSELLDWSGEGGTKIICNVTLGGTNANELEKLRREAQDCGQGANLKHHPSLHAKVFLSDRGLVVGSANASNNGLGLVDGEPAGHVEAGSFHEAGTDAWLTATEWFKRTFESSTVVDDAAIATARRTWVTPRAPMSSGPVKVDGSLIDLVCKRSDAFQDVGFVFVKQPNDPAVIADLNEQELEEGDQPVLAWNVNDAFTEWARKDTERWPAYFVEYWLRGAPRARILRVVKTRLEDNVGHVLAERCAPQVKNLLRDRSIDLPSLDRIASADGALALKLCGAEGLVCRDGFELVEAVESLRP